MTDILLFPLAALAVVSVLVFLPPGELSSTLLAFSIQQSAGRPAGGRVEAVCKEVQHQAILLDRHVLGQTNTRTRYKQEQAEERKGGFMKEIC